MDIFLIAGLALLGWFLASFINYAADVLPFTRRFTPALCQNCQRNRPFVEYLLMQACPQCGQRRNLRAWSVQIVIIAAVIGYWFLDEKTVTFIEWLVLLVYFGVVTVIDLEHRLILHPTSLVGAVIAVVIGLSKHGWLSTLLGGLAGFGVMFGLYLLGFLFAKAIARYSKREVDEEALGFGDVALCTVLGLLMGWPAIVANLILGILLGGAGSLLVILFMLATRRYKALMAIPYGPFLIAGAVLVLLQVGN